MRLIIFIALASAFIIQIQSEDTTEIPTDLPPLKIDKTLRQALLKALEDLETESAEQKDPPTAEGLLKKLQEQPIEPEDPTTVPSLSDRFKGASITYEQFPGDCDHGPSEDKLQNSTFESEKVLVNDLTPPETEKIEKVVFKKYDVLLNDQASSSLGASQPVSGDQIETRSVKSSILSNAIDDGPKSKSLSGQEKENLAISSSNGIASASANALVLPVPTVASPTERPLVKKNDSAVLPTVPTTMKGKEKEKAEVTFFQAPLVAAFTVQQDERGIAKSVVPLYKPNSGQALTLQEQLEFKERLLEKQLAELQAQQFQQTQFLLRQQQLYQEQQRQKYRHFYLQEQQRLKLLEEQKLKQHQAQAALQVQPQSLALVQSQSQVPLVQPQISLPPQQQLSLQQPQQVQTLQQQLPSPPAPALPLQQQHNGLRQQVNTLQQDHNTLQQQHNTLQQEHNALQQHHHNTLSFQQQQLPSQQPLGSFSHHNPLALQLPAKTSNVQFQSSLAFQLPNAVAPPPFHHLGHQERLRLAQVHQAPQVSQVAPVVQVHQPVLLGNQPLPRLQPVQQEQRFQQSFAPVQVDFQPSVASGHSRFNRQEAFGSVGNFGINDNRHSARNNLLLELPRVPAQPFVTFNQFSPSFRHAVPQRHPTAANQIQQLLFQSGVAGDLGRSQGNSNPEDLNIVSKVLALNVGAVPTKNLKYNDDFFGRA